MVVSNKLYDILKKELDCHEEIQLAGYRSMNAPLLLEHFLDELEAEESFELAS